MSQPPVKFLLVDDVAENLIALEALLRRDGLELLQARSGPEALELLLKHDVALALLDVQMPEMDGFELAELMRGTERTRRVPIIFVTAGVMDNQRRFRGYETGAVDFLFKPIEPHILRSKAEVFFDLYRQRQEVSRQRDELHQLAAERADLLGREKSSRQRAEFESRLKDEFLATLSHELRTPLNAILGWTQLIATGTMSDDEVREGHAVIERNARAQAQLIEDLLDMSRIISGKIRLDLQPMDVSEIVSTALNSVQPAADNKGVRLHRVIDPRSHCPIQGDASRLQQVAWNLLSNAVKFTPRGGSINVQLIRVGDAVELRVIDTGEGIAAEFLPHVFDRFRQADGTTTRQHGGLGLGLSIVKNLVELHGGTITAASEGRGRGAAFVVSLPVAAPRLAEPEPAAPRPAAPQPAAPALRLENVKVLVIDDDADARDLLRRLLQRYGAAVTLASSTEEAIEALGAGAFDVLVSDIGMPREDGYELIRRVRQLGEAGRDLPAIALTAFVRAEDRARALHAGFQAHLAKPVNPSDLINTVVGLIGVAP